MKWIVIFWKGRVYYERIGYVIVGKGKCPRLYWGRGSVLDNIGEGEVSYIMLGKGKCPRLCWGRGSVLDYIVEGEVS